MRKNGLFSNTKSTFLAHIYNHQSRPHHSKSIKNDNLIVILCCVLYSVIIPEQKINLIENVLNPDLEGYIMYFTTLLTTRFT